MKAKPWGECPLCKGEGFITESGALPNSGLYEVDKECVCVSCRRAAFEEAMAPVIRLRDEQQSRAQYFLSHNSGPLADEAHQNYTTIRHVEAAIRAKMEGE
ncbi:MAG: hypothetical protein WC683_10070 [bacterium]